MNNCKPYLNDRVRLRIQLLVNCFLQSTEFLPEFLRNFLLRVLDERDAREMLRGYKVLEGMRGQGPRDIDALVKATVGLSDIFAAHRNHFSDLEINPIMVRAQGGGVAAVDVWLVRK